MRGMVCKCQHRGEASHPVEKGAVENSAALKGAVQDLYKAGEDCDIVNENCLLVPIGVNAKDMIEIFKNA